MRVPHPTTGQRQYSDAELEFMRAMERWRRLNGVRFPTCSETLLVLESLGYRRVAKPTALPRNRKA